MEIERNILIICEGLFEIKLFNKLNGLYPYNLNFSFYKYATNFHIFGKSIQNYCNDNSFEITDIDIIQVLKEIKYDPILDLKYTDILLVFDFDPHDARINIDLLLQLQEFFYDSTTQGQLYINYPMVESALDFESLPDKTFINKRVSSNCLNRGQYKNRVKSTSHIGNIKDLNQLHLPIILKQTYLKLDTIVKIQDTKYIDLLKKECELHTNEKMIDILNTSLLFLFDYNETFFLNYIG